MQKQKTIYSTTIAIDAEHSALRFSQMVDNDKSTIVNDIKATRATSTTRNSSTDSRMR